jgi:hypothetical protein
MRKTFTMLAMLALASHYLAIAPAAMAQTKNGSKNGSGSSAGGGAGAKPITPEAPIGHRQPRAADVPSSTDDPMHINADDAALDKQIKSICRGC